MNNNNDNRNFGTNNKEEANMNNGQQVRTTLDHKVVEMMSRLDTEQVIKELKELVDIYKYRTVYATEEKTIDDSISAYAHLEFTVIPKLEDSVYTEVKHAKDIKVETFVNDTKDKLTAKKDEAMSMFNGKSVASVTDKALDNADVLFGKAKETKSNLSNKLGNWFINSAKKEASRK